MSQHRHNFYPKVLKTAEQRMLCIVDQGTTMGTARRGNNGKPVQVPIVGRVKTCASLEVTGAPGGLSIYLRAEGRTGLVHPTTDTSSVHRLCYSRIVAALVFSRIFSMVVFASDLLRLRTIALSVANRSAGRISARNSAAAVDTVR